MVLLGLGGCAHQEVAKRLPIRHPPAFSASGEVEMPDRWWTAFRDSALDYQIDRALEDNFTLDVAWQRLCAARALTRREASDLFPDLDGVAEADGLLRSDGPEQSDYELGVAASYELDLWGRIGYGVQAESLRASATMEDYQATALTLSAEVARVWFSLVEAYAQLALVNQQTETNRKVLDLLESRFGLGQGDIADVLRQRQLVQSTQEQTVVVQLHIEELEHLLAVLQGQPPQQARYITGTTLPALPPLPETGVPAELLNRRPDVRRDYLALEAADRDLASAISAQYPRINLGASVTTAAEKPENLFRDWIGSFAGQLIAPLLDGGERRAEVDRTAAVARQRLAEYGETVLIAYREVEDALARERYTLQRIALLDSQLKLARQTSERLNDQYRGGVTDYVAVLIALVEEQRLQREALSARLELVLNRIALYLALAGDFESRPQPRGGDPAPEPVHDE